MCQAVGKAEPGPGEAKGGHPSLGRAPLNPLKANQPPRTPGRDLSPRDPGKGVGKEVWASWGPIWLHGAPARTGRPEGRLQSLTVKVWSKHQEQ